MSLYRTRFAQDQGNIRLWNASHISDCAWFEGVRYLPVVGRSLQIGLEFERTTVSVGVSLSRVNFIGALQTRCYGVDHSLQELSGAFIATNVGSCDENQLFRIYMLIIMLINVLPIDF